MEPVTTFVIEGSGRDLRVPEDTYAPLPGELGDDVLAADIERDTATVVRRVLEHGDDVDNDFYIVLPVAGPWSILEVSGELRGVSASERAGRWYVVLGGANAMWPDRLPTTTFVLATDDGLWHADAWQLRPHPLAHAAGRDWTWRRPNTFGPYTITIVADGDLARFAASCAPTPYIEAGHWLEIEGDRLTLNSEHEPAEPAVAAFERSVLCALGRGAAGSVRWWLAMEHDYYEPFAMGDDGESLIAYLLGDQSAAEATQARLLARHDIDASSATTYDELAAQVSAGLGAATPVDDAGFDRWLTAQPLDRLPRHISIQLSIKPPPGIHERLVAAQPFIVWRLIGR